jgi:hypothetical protein
MRSSSERSLLTAADRWGVRWRAHPWGAMGEPERAACRPLHRHDSGEPVLAGLNVHSDAQDAFERAAVGVGLIVATQGALVFSRMQARSVVGLTARAV